VVIGAGLLTTGSNRKHQDHVRASNSLSFLIFTGTSSSGYQGFRLLTSDRGWRRAPTDNSLCAVNGMVSTKGAARCRLPFFFGAFDCTDGSLAALTAVLSDLARTVHPPFLVVRLTAAIPC
jgi:hypothetical protein